MASKDSWWAFTYVTKSNEILWIIIKNSELIEQEGNYSSYLEREKEKAKSSNKSNEKLLLQFKLAKLEAEISTTKDEAKKQELIKEYEKLKEK